MNGRKLAAFALSGVMAVGLTACGGNGEPNESPAGGSGGELEIKVLAIHISTNNPKSALFQVFHGPDKIGHGNDGFMFQGTG